MNISVEVSKNKFEDIKKVCPNFVQNRFDLLYGRNFELLEVKTDENSYFIPFHIEFITCKLGLWLVEISKEAVDEIIKFIFNKYWFVLQIKILSGINEFENAYKSTDYWLNLPDNEEAFISQLTANERYNLRRHIKKLTNDFGGYKIEKYHKDNIPLEVIQTYFKFKKLTLGKSYALSPKTYLKKYAVTDVFALKVQDKTESVVVISENDNNLYLENISYNPDFSKYSLGVTICYEMIKDAIQNKKSRIFFGASNKDDYKRRLCNNSQDTFSVKIKRKDLK